MTSSRTYVQNPPKVIAELGINHRGNFETAAELITISAKAGCWGVKFQYRSLYADPLKFSAKEIGDEIVEPNIRDNYLSPSKIIELHSLGNSLGLQVGISFFKTADFLEFDSHKFDFYKTPSAVFKNLQLSEKFLESSEKVLVSTGMQREEDIVQFVEHFGAQSGLVLMHCVSNYPTRSENSRLGYINRLRQITPYSVGYSSHDEYWENTLFSLQFSPEYIERHVTLSKEEIGIDQSSSSTPDELYRMMRLLGTYNSAIEGSDEPRKLNQGEKINLQNLGLGLYAKRNFDVGEAISSKDLFERPPLVGLSQSDFQRLSTNVLNIGLDAGKPLTAAHFQSAPSLEPPNLATWANSISVGLPARLHDFQAVHSKFGLLTYELHLSFGELNLGFDVSQVDENYRIAIHMPDYISPYDLLDPFSLDKEVRSQSLIAFEKVRELAHRIGDKTGRTVPIVASLSSASLSLENFYINVHNLFSTISSENVIFSLQWLPPYAWYFGGSVQINKVNSTFDIVKLLEMKIPITLDFSHLHMGENAGLYKSYDIIESLRENVVHIHLSGAEGVDGEGVEFDSTSERHIRLVHDAMQLAHDRDVAIIVETWQGHLNNFAGFSKSLSALKDLASG